jgi:methionyl-tRNA formyltransferase
VPILKALHDDKDFAILEVVTQPDRPAHRGKLLTAPAVKRAAQNLGLPVYQPETIKTSEALKHLADLGADVFVVAAYGKIFPKDVLAIPPFGCVNVHGSLLPAYRGASPIFASVAAGDETSGVTIMMMGEKLDDGPTLGETAVTLGEKETAGSLTTKLASAAADLLGPTLKLYLQGLAKPKEQDHAKASYTKILSREDGHVDWTKSAEEIERLVRALSPWPEAWSRWNRKGTPLKLTIKEASVLHPTAGCVDGAANGQICKMSDGSLAVDCGKGSLTIHRLQLEGKPETDGKAFLNGYADAVGSVLE